MRGLAEKIWKVLPPMRAAVRAAFSSDLAMEVWAPIRKISMVAGTICTSSLLWSEVG